MYFEERALFMRLLRDDLRRVQDGAERRGLVPVVRLNGTSDLDWLDIIKDFPKIQFYDYTKVPSRLEHALPANYHLTFSRTEHNVTACLRAIRLGFNVAVVFESEPKDVFALPMLKVLDGDAHDLRFLDKRSETGLGSVVALKAKGKAKKDQTGFVYRCAA
jgi:hypothetical protein